MTLKQCRKKTGQSEELCAALIKAGLKLHEVSEEWMITLRGFTIQEHRALDNYYRTPPPPMGECEPGCELCARDKRKRKHRFK